jgi:5-formyltetrahydrofolate cyclo-ligase
MEQPGGAAASDTTRPGATEKTHRRALIRDLRSRRPAAERAAFAVRLAGWVPPEGTRRVSCFVGVGAEPDTGPLIAAFGERGIEVLLPITLADFSLDWALYTGDEELANARYGLREPTGPRLGVAALADVDLVVVPALAIDEEGRRLGQGAGCYDRALLHVPAGTPVLAVVFDDERLTDALPEESHDRRVDGVLP